MKDSTNCLLNFSRTKEHGPELNLLLDEMLNRRLVVAIEYSNLKSNIPGKPPDEEEEEEETKIVNVVVHHVIEHNVKELSDLLMELRNDVDGELLDALFDLELLVGKFLVDEYENEQSLLPLIEERRLKLEASPPSKSKLLHMNMLLDDINNNRRRIREIFQHIDDADDNEEGVWKMLVREGLLSGDQFEKLSALDSTDMEKSVLEGAKIGQGVSFLPMSFSDLHNIFGKLWEKIEKHGSKMVKTKLLPIREVLLRRGGVTVPQYAVLMQELEKQPEMILRNS